MENDLTICLLVQMEKVGSNYGEVDLERGCCSNIHACMFINNYCSKYVCK